MQTDDWGHLETQEVLGEKKQDFEIQKHKDVTDAPNQQPQKASCLSPQLASNFEHLGRLQPCAAGHESTAFKSCFEAIEPVKVPEPKP
eukprot:2411406-Amphidinium_carterae.1